MNNSSADDIILRTHAISMLFPGTIALDSVDYQVWRGKVNVIIGENGAGKSTLMKILAGVQQPSSGEMTLNGNPVRFANTRDAAAHGIGMVHQELNLFENLTVAENIFLGREIQKGMTPIDEAEQEKRTAELLTRLDQPISPRDLVGNLKVGQQQLVEIAKALAEDADILILADSMDRLSANSWRFPLAKMAFLICSMVVPIFVAWYGKTDEARAYMMAMSFIAVLATAFMLLCFWGTKERYQVSVETDKVPFTKQLGIMLKAKPVVVFYLFKITSSIAFVIKGSVTIYFVKYFLNRGDGFVSGLLSATAIAGIIAPMIAIQLIKRNKLSKLGTLKVAQLGGGVAALCLYFVNPEQISLACVLLVLSVLMAELGSITAWALRSSGTRLIPIRMRSAVVKRCGTGLLSSHSLPR
jgi:ABC-type branched-subunit amino acid transport system ATPase component